MFFIYILDFDFILASIWFKLCFIILLYKFIDCLWHYLIFFFLNLDHHYESHHHFLIIHLDFFLLHLIHHFTFKLIFSNSIALFFFIFLHNIIFFPILSTPFFHFFLKILIAYQFIISWFFEISIYFPSSYFSFDLL
jgi:hypothetical protein